MDKINADKVYSRLADHYTCEPRRLINEKIGFHVTSVTRPSSGQVLASGLAGRDTQVREVREAINEGFYWRVALNGWVKKWTPDSSNYKRQFAVKRAEAQGKLTQVEELVQDLQLEDMELASRGVNEYIQRCARLADISREPIRMDGDKALAVFNWSAYTIIGRPIDWEIDNSHDQFLSDCRAQLDARRSRIIGGFRDIAIIEGDTWGSYSSSAPIRARNNLAHRIQDNFYSQRHLIRFIVGKENQEEAPPPIGNPVFGAHESEYPFDNEYPMRNPRLTMEELLQIVD